MSHYSVFSRDAFSKRNNIIYTTLEVTVNRFFKGFLISKQQVSA